MANSEFSLALNEKGEVVLILGALRLVLGSKDFAAEELRRFLAEIDEGASG